MKKLSPKALKWIEDNHKHFVGKMLLLHSQQV